MERILDIVDSIAYEKGLEPDSVKEALNEAMLRTCRNTFGRDLKFETEIDEKSKNIKVFQIVTVVEDGSEEAEEKDIYITLEEAKKIDPDMAVGDELKYEMSIDNMGRGAINDLYKNIEYQIQRMLENHLFQKFVSMKGKIVSGSVVRVDDFENTYIEIDEIRAIMPMKNRIKGESFKVGNVVKSVLRHVSFDRKAGIMVELSRTTPKFLEELLKLEVPEIKDGEVEIVRSARIPGERAKIALKSESVKVDPVGATVGVKGVRISAVSQELKNENIDCIEYSETPEIFISRSLSPALISSVKIEEPESEDERKIAKVIIPAGEKAKAIGKKGTNIKLASMLTGYDIEITEKESSISRDEDGSDTSSSEKKDISSLASLFKD